MSSSAAGREPRTAVVVVTGGIAAYKTCEVVRRLRDRDVSVRVAMTSAATRFVQPTTFAALSGHRVISDLFADPHPEEIPHVRWAERCDLLCVAPATADFLAKMAHGVADDFASTLHLAVTAPVLVAPAMEDDMLRHPSVQRNLATLQERGVVVVGPDSGALASGRRGPGRMSSPEAIVAVAERLLDRGTPTRWLRGSRVLVVSGPTREPVDPMRFLSNRSSGKTGRALAVEAFLLGAEVTMISGPVDLEDPAGATVIRVETAAEMAAAVHAHAADSDIVVMAAAVADFRPAEVLAEKMSKGGRDEWHLTLERTEDILASLGADSPRPLLVGFAAESSEVEERARDKLRKKGCELIVANRLGVEGLGPGAERNAVVVLDARGGRREVAAADKGTVATEVWEAVRAYQRATKVSP